jgi:uncharacterized membrane protein YfcA
LDANGGLPIASSNGCFFGTSGVSVVTGSTSVITVPVMFQFGIDVETAGFAVTFLLGIYGGLFSGGYVTILTAIFVAMFRMTFIEAIATTKEVNIFSSGIATAIFMWRGLVDYRLGIILGLTMFVGAMLGSRFARRLEGLSLKRIYLAAVWLLGLKTLLFDVFRVHSTDVPQPSSPSR